MKVVWRAVQRVLRGIFCTINFLDASKKFSFIAFFSSVIPYCAFFKLLRRFLCGFVNVCHDLLNMLTIIIVVAI